MITKDSVKNKAIEYYDFPNGDWKWLDQDEFWHLMRQIDGKWVELTKGLKAINCWSYRNGDWEWQDMQGKSHEVRGLI